MPLPLKIRALLAAVAAASLLAAPACRADPSSEALAMYAGGAKPEGDLLLKKLVADPKTWGPALVALSERKGLPERLYIDSARAFIYAGDSYKMMELAAANLSRARFEVLDRSEWLYLCQKIGQREADAMPCARRLLDEPAFFIPVLGGGDGIGKDYALMFLLTQMPETRWNREIGDRLWRGSDNPTSQMAMLTAMFYAVSLRDDAILGKFADDPTRPPQSRARAEAMLTQMSAMERNASPERVEALEKTMGIPANAGEEELRALRRKALTQVSRGGLLELERYTFLIRAKALPRWKERLRKLD